MLQKIINHFIWSDWESLWEQIDRYKRKRYEILKSVNKNWLSKYKRVLINYASCHESDLKIN